MKFASQRKVADLENPFRDSRHLRPRRDYPNVPSLAAPEGPWRVILRALGVGTRR